MKRLFTLLTIIVMSQAQAQGLDFGIKAGLNYANVSGIEDFNQRQGISAGLFAGARLGDKLGFQIDALYSQQGAEVDQSISQVISEFNLDYISIPIVLKYYLTENVNIHAGPQLGILLNEETSVFNQTISAVEANTADWLGTIGVGLDLPLGLRAEARYSFGLSRVNGSVSLPDFDDLSNSRTQMTTLSIGYSWL
ncbi:MAG: PorT family protein [Flavobacteriaceae bacterium]|nr:PorT family protein [Flavobacteriaceae bacterium]